MMSFGADAVGGRGNPYTDLLLSAISSDVEVLLFSWRAAFLETYDVFHLHWPEHLLAGTGVRRWRNALLARVLLLRFRLVGVKVIRTAHNLTPHADVRFGARSAQRALEESASTWIVMNRSTVVPVGAKAVHIPHGHYRDRIPQELRATRVRKKPANHPVRILYFGPIRPYKGVSSLLRAMSEVGAGIQLSVSGRNSDDGLSRAEVESAEMNPQIELDFRQLDEGELFAKIVAADAVILPYTKLQNSGALLMALSLNRPVIVPSTPATEELREEFGSEWVITYAGELSAEALRRVVQVAAARASQDELEMGGRDWSKIGRHTVDLYRDLVSARPGVLHQ